MLPLLLNWRHTAKKSSDPLQQRLLIRAVLRIMSHNHSAASRPLQTVEQTWITKDTMNAGGSIIKGSSLTSAFPWGQQGIANATRYSSLGHTESHFVPVREINSNNHSSTALAWLVAMFNQPLRKPSTTTPFLRSGPSQNSRELAQSACRSSYQRTPAGTPKGHGCNP